MVSVTDPYGRILGFLTGAATFLSCSSSVVLTKLSGPRSRPTTFFSCSTGNRTRASRSVVMNSALKENKKSGELRVTLVLTVHSPRHMHNYTQAQSCTCTLNSVIVHVTCVWNIRDLNIM
jgi:hypothetical protein